MTLDSKIAMIYTLLWLDVAAYTGLLFFSGKNTIRYVIRMGKWDNFFVAMFYLFTLAVAFSRILYFLCTYMVYIDWQGWFKAYSVTTITSRAAFYSKAALGVFQIGTMNELSIKLKHSAELITDQQAKKYIIIN